MFVDRIKVFAQAGNGGRGAVSFRREKFVPRGGPDGGDGGRGGSVILRPDIHTDNLANLFYEPIIKAKAGGHGMGKQMYGRAAADKIVKVPVGTVVYRIDAPVPRDQDNEPSGKEIRAERETPADPISDGSPAGSPGPAAEQIADLEHDGQDFVLCAGGKGGRGNIHYKTAENRAPTQYTEGVEGEQGHFLLELRTIADAALVGYPNAGKSTLLGKVSAAHPKVAAYPFTTLRPSVGVVELDDYQRATIADIPGLIEGAHRNVGLGHDFLRHITRCPFLLFVVDIAGSEGRHPVADLQSLRREIDLYDRRLSQRPWAIVANKMDLMPSEENLQVVAQRFPNIRVIPVSAERGEGIPDLKEQMRVWLAAETEQNNAKSIESNLAVAAD